jgi:hypothetical protein
MHAHALYRQYLRRMGLVLDGYMWYSSKGGRPIISDAKALELFVSDKVLEFEKYRTFYEDTATVDEILETYQGKGVGIHFQVCPCTVGHGVMLLYGKLSTNAVQTLACPVCGYIASFLWPIQLDELKLQAGT